MLFSVLFRRHSQTCQLWSPLSSVPVFVFPFPEWHRVHIYFTSTFFSLMLHAYLLHSPPLRFDSKVACHNSKYDCMPACGSFDLHRVIIKVKCRLNCDRPHLVYCWMFSLPVVLFTRLLELTTSDLHPATMLATTVGRERKGQTRDQTWDYPITCRTLCHWATQPVCGGIINSNNNCTFETAYITNCDTTVVQYFFFVSKLAHNRGIIEYTLLGISVRLPSPPKPVSPTCHGYMIRAILTHWICSIIYVWFSEAEWHYLQFSYGLIVICHAMDYETRVASPPTVLEGDWIARTRQPSRWASLILTWIPWITCKEATHQPSHPT